MANTANRRAILSAVLAAGATAALPAAAAAATSAPPLSPIDRRVLDLWRRRAKLKAIQARLDERYAATDAQMPAWSNPGPKFLMPDGSPAVGIDEISAWPMVADLRSRVVHRPGYVNARPSRDDLQKDWHIARWRRCSVAEANSYLERITAEFDERQRQIEAEEDRLGITLLEKRLDDADNAICATEAAFDELIETSMLALAAVLMIFDNQCEVVEGLHRAALAAIQPRLIGSIAEDADRVLSEGQEGARA